MATLTGDTIANTYAGLLSVNGAISTAGVEVVEDGAGTDTSLWLSNERCQIKLGTGSADDFTVNDGSNDILKVEGDTKDVTLLDDLIFISDSAVVKFGADGDTTLTHTDGTGLTLNSTNKLCFNDASQYIQGASATVLDIAATDEIELTATEVEINVTTLDINGNGDVSGTLTVGGTLTVNAAAVFNEGSGDYDFRVESNTLDHCLFVDSGTNRVGVGLHSGSTSAPDSKLHILSTTTSSTSAACHIECSESAVDSNDTLLWLDWSGDANIHEASAPKFVSFHDSGGEIGYITTSADGAMVPGSLGAVFNSDVRLKKDIVDTGLNGLEVINSLKLRDFKWNENTALPSLHGKHVECGLVANEVYEVYPIATTGTPDNMNDDGTISPMGLMDNQFISVLLKAVQELSTSNDALKARIEVLEAA